MAKDWKTRIEQRNGVAAQYRAQQSFFWRAVSGVGLGLANTLDRLTGWMEDNRLVFAHATTTGAMRGLVYGGGAAIIASVFLGLGPILPTLFVISAATLGAWIGMSDGQKALEHNLYSGRKKFSDKIAIRFGAVPEKMPQWIPSDGYIVPEVRKNPSDPPDDDPPGSSAPSAFVARERERREQAQAASRQL